MIDLHKDCDRVDICIGGVVAESRSYKADERKTSQNTDGVRCECVTPGESAVHPDLVGVILSTREEDVSGYLPFWANIFR